MDIRLNGQGCQLDEQWLASRDMLTTVVGGVADLLKETVNKTFGERNSQPYVAQLEPARVATLSKHAELFSCDELTRVMQIWNSYMTVRRLENPQISGIERTFVQELAGESGSESSEVDASQEAGYPIAKSFIKAVIAKRLERLLAKPAPTAVQFATERTIAKCVPELCQALKGDGTDLWMGQLARVVRLMDEPVGLKLSVLEGDFVSKFQQLACAGVK